jgi:L-lactate permease
MRARSALVYTVLRLLAFLVPLGVLLLFPVFRELPWLAAIFAALIGLSLSVLFLRRPLEDVTTSMAERRAERRAAETASHDADAAAEDAAADGIADPPSPDSPR